jgi:DNA ligase-associated metallophosphoesterase
LKVVVNLVLNGVGLVADLSGALLWPERSLLVVADLHLEKGSAFAQRGQLLPPYDTTATLDRLAQVIGRTQPATVICLGDSFHDSRASERIAPRDAARLAAMTAERDWIWITGNHDPEPPAHLGGRVAESVTLGPLCFRHEAQEGAGGEVSGHYHPVAAIRVRGKRVRARCFASDGQRLIMPSFGAYTGGLNVLDRALAPLLGRRFEVRMIGNERLFAFPSARLEPDPERVAYQ